MFCNIGAGIVTYNPELQRLRKNIEAFCNNVKSIVVVDNSSDNLSEIEKLIGNYNNVELKRNGQNMGVGYALNQIVEQLRSENLEWALLLDQDSIVDTEILSKYADFERDKVGLLSPYIIDINKITFEDYKTLSKLMKPKSPIKFAITSGSLVNIRICELVGGFDSGLFIDGVDTDFSRKLDINGFKQFRINSTYIMHEVGKAEPTHVFRIHRDNAGSLSIKRYYRTNHSPTRIYYMARNNVILTRRYKKYYSPLKGYLFLSGYMLGKIIFERNKKSVLKAVVKGITDGFKYKENGYTPLYNRA